MIGFDGPLRADFGKIETLALSALPHHDIGIRRRIVMGTITFSDCTCLTAASPQPEHPKTEHNCAG
ncbi:MAG: hypothetical protein ACR2PI_10350, partial [Hyphomicrobiaceae bacterium]